jgi:inhibitor of cysteine peptidase
MTIWRRTRFFLIVGIALFHSAAACGDAADLAQTSAAAMNDAGSDKVIKIGTADNGGEKAVPVGDQFEVTLPENPTTGYRWQLHAPVNPALSVESNSYVAAAPGLIGSGGLRSWRFRALKEGAVHLVIDNGRSWEPAPVETFAITIDVKPQ